MLETKVQNRMVRVYDSIGEMAAHAASKPTYYSADSERDSWYGGTFAEAMEMSRTGWTEHLDASLELAESAVLMADKEHLTDSFLPVWDVSGAEVDVARYLSGEPECMIDFPLTKVSKDGRVITLVADVGVSMGVSPENIIKRGMLIAAFALALSRLGHSIEMWAVNHCGSSGRGRGDKDNEVWVKVKGENDTLDPAHILFAYAHPVFLRRLLFAETELFPSPYRCEGGHIPWAYHKSQHNTLPNEIRLPPLRSGSDVPNADEFLREHLGELGLLAE